MEASEGRQVPVAEIGKVGRRDFLKHTAKAAAVVGGAVAGVVTLETAAAQTPPPAPTRTQEQIDAESERVRQEKIKAFQTANPPTPTATPRPAVGTSAGSGGTESGRVSSGSSGSAGSRNNRREWFQDPYLQGGAAVTAAIGGAYLLGRRGGSSKEAAKPKTSKPAGVEHAVVSADEATAEESQPEHVSRRVWWKPGTWKAKRTPAEAQAAATPEPTVPTGEGEALEPARIEHAVVSADEATVALQPGTQVEDQAEIQRLTVRRRELEAQQQGKEACEEYMKLGISISPETTIPYLVHQLILHGKWSGNPESQQRAQAALAFVRNEANRIARHVPADIEQGSSIARTLIAEVIRGTVTGIITSGLIKAADIQATLQALNYQYKTRPGIADATEFYNIRQEQPVASQSSSPASPAVVTPQPVSSAAEASSPPPSAEVPSVPEVQPNEGAYRELVEMYIQITPTSTVDTLMKQLERLPKPWVNDQTTRNYIQSAINFLRTEMIKYDPSFQNIDSKNSDEQKLMVAFINTILWGRGSGCVAGSQGDKDLQEMLRNAGYTFETSLVPGNNLVFIRNVQKQPAASAPQPTSDDKEAARREEERRREAFIKVATSEWVGLNTTPDELVARLEVKSPGDAENRNLAQAAVAFVQTVAERNRGYLIPLGVDPESDSGMDLLARFIRGITLREVACQGSQVEDIKRMLHDAGFTYKTKINPYLALSASEFYDIQPE
ncbi:hypothetical protein HYW41_00705 [Candidatus Daviesbacteria bacterium]|nr:hypothetical protein [Candidatus Daviesbacteria bacterium]